MSHLTLRFCALIVHHRRLLSKVLSKWAFEAELKPAINPKDFLPEFHPQGNFMG
jgi:hypothetical protein